MSGGKDEIRAGVSHSGKLGKGGYTVNMYPITPKGKGVHVGVFVGQDITERLTGSTFLTSDLGAKTYYGETEFTYGLGPDFSFLLQARYGGKFGEKFQPEVHAGCQVRF
ncbi:MAG: hypothetical protein KKF46_07830 [Nanoarchaeota archaeon]|nr:hypothetical protein [Nanoarchaeota archaeon]MBU1322237.1 hypothetical protein [Nanoarchaeota archaeon]MBU1598046.1 hypothetical protein [Nanoarchaeota archaeon]MBU2442051.1 hypothetical protein [Nanoarchaeota archaeon]